MLLGKQAWACVVMNVCHLIIAQMIVIRWNPYNENVPFACSSRWRVCAYCSYVQAIARTRTNLYCACRKLSDEWEQREWIALYVTAWQVSNSPPLLSLYVAFPQGVLSMPSKRHTCSGSDQIGLCKTKPAPQWSVCESLFRISYCLSVMIFQ